MTRNKIKIRIIRNRRWVNTVSMILIQFLDQREVIKKSLMFSVFIFVVQPFRSNKNKTSVRVKAYMVMKILCITGVFFTSELPSKLEESHCL